MVDYGASLGDSLELGAAICDPDEDTRKRWAKWMHRSGICCHSKPHLANSCAHDVGGCDVDENDNGKMFNDWAWLGDLLCLDGVSLENQFFGHHTLTHR